MRVHWGWYEDIYFKNERHSIIPIPRNFLFQNIENYKLHFLSLESDSEILDGQASQIFYDEKNVSSEYENYNDDITNDFEEANTDPAGLTIVNKGNSYSLCLKRQFRL